MKTQTIYERMKAMGRKYIAPAMLAASLYLGGSEAYSAEQEKPRVVQAEKEEKESKLEKKAEGENVSFPLGYLFLGFGIGRTLSIILMNRRK